MPKRRKSTRDLHPVFYVFCEGEKTEPYYLEHYVKNHCAGYKNIQIQRIKLSDIWSVAKTNRTDPVSLVTKAVRKKERSPTALEDRYWCVYDREAANKVKAQIHVKALSLAAAHNICIAFSNVCFEVWLLLHKQSACAPYASYDDLHKRSKLLTYYPRYDKGDRREFSDSDIAQARLNARRMNAGTLGIPVNELGNGNIPCKLVDGNPYTDVYRLLDAIDTFFVNAV